MRTMLGAMMLGMASASAVAPGQIVVGKMQELNLEQVRRDSSSPLRPPVTSSHFLCFAMSGALMEHVVGGLAAGGAVLAAGRRRLRLSNRP